MEYVRFSVRLCDGDLRVHLTLDVVCLFLLRLFMVGPYPICFHVPQSPVFAEKAAPFQAVRFGGHRMETMQARRIQRCGPVRSANTIAHNANFLFVRIF